MVITVPIKHKKIIPDITLLLLYYLINIKHIKLYILNTHEIQMFNFKIIQNVLLDINHLKL